MPEFDGVMNFVNMQIANSAENAFSKEHPAKGSPLETFVGGPYSEFELGMIARRKSEYATFQSLHWWVYGFGAFNTVGPLAFVWAIGNVLAFQKVNMRVISTSCACLAFLAIFLMVVRGY